GRVRGDQGGVRADPGAGPGPRGQDHGAAAHPGPRREGDDTPRLRPGGAAARRHGQGAQGPRPAPGLAHLRRPLLALHAVAPELRPRRLWRRRHGALAAVGLLALVLGHAAGVLQEQQRQQWRRGGDGGRRGGAADEPGQRRRGPAVALLRRGLVADPRRAPPAGPARVPHRGRHGRRGRASAAPAVRRRRVPKPQRRRRRALPVRRRVGQRRARAPQERVGERALLRGRRRPRLEAVPLLRARVLQKRERLQVRARRPPRRPRRREDGPGRRGAAVPGLPPPLQVPAPGRGRRLRLLPHRLPPRLPLRGEQVPQLAPAAAAAAKRRPKRGCRSSADAGRRRGAQVHEPPPSRPRRLREHDEPGVPADLPHLPGGQHLPRGGRLQLLQHLRPRPRRAHPLPAEAHVRVRHLRLPGDGEADPGQGQPALHLRRARARQALQGEGQGPRQVQEAAGREGGLLRLRVSHRAGRQRPLRSAPDCARMLQHSNSANEMLLRRKLEEQQQAVELQQAIELQSRRLMGLQLLDLKTRSAAAAAPTPIGKPFSPTHTTAATPTLESPPDSGEQGNGCGFLFPRNNAVNGADKDETSGDSTTSPNTDSDQSAEHNLPDSPFASPTKSGAFARDPFAPTESEIAAAAASTGCNAAYNGGINSNGARNGGINHHLLPPALDIPSPKPYFFPMSRLSSDHGAVGM
uniref:Uncharacterized protein n=1 Tax=Aegilops tauschii subsp. strangulata TaxID=200361 RepID=A0A453ANC2_AEGTS